MRCLKKKDRQDFWVRTLRHCPHHRFISSTKIVAITYISPRIPYVAFTYVAFTFVRSPTRSPGRDIDRPPGVYIFGFFFFFCTFRSVLSFCTSVIVSNCFRPRLHQHDQIFRFQIRKRNLHAPWLRTFPPLPRWSCSQSSNRLLIVIIVVLFNCWICCVFIRHQF